jgi:CRP-like cAMP-binding protein
MCEFLKLVFQSLSNFNEQASDGAVAWPRKERYMQPTAETLAGIELFKELDADKRGTIAQQCKLQQFSRNQVVVQVQDKTVDVFFLVSGHVRATLFSVTGKEVAFRDMGSGEVFGDLAAIDGMPRSSSVVAVQDSLILSMSSQTFWRMIETYPSISTAELKRLTALIRLLSERVFEFSTLGVRNRIHAELLRLAQDHQQGDGTAQISPAPKHAEIASRISTHREAVTRELNHLEQSGLIKRSGSSIVIRDLARLSNMVKEVKGA